MPDSEPIGMRAPVEVNRGNEAPVARHVLNDDGGCVGDVLPNMPRDDAGVRVETATGNEADDDAQSLALEEGQGMNPAAAAHGEHDDCGREREKSSLHKAGM